VKGYQAVPSSGVFFSLPRRGHLTTEPEARPYPHTTRHIGELAPNIDVPVPPATNGCERTDAPSQTLQIPAPPATILATAPPALCFAPGFTTTDTSEPAAHIIPQYIACPTAYTPPAFIHLSKLLPRFFSTAT